MRFRVHRRARVCSPDLIFEELEQRIVLDASVDSGAVGSHAGGPDLLHGLLPGSDQGGADSHAHEGGADWTLEYSSDPSSKMIQLLDHDDLALVDVELGSPAPDVTVNIDPVEADGNVDVSLGGAVTLDGDTSQTLKLTLTAGIGVDSVSVASFDGLLNEAQNAVDTAYATISDCFDGTAQVLVQLEDEDGLASSGIINIEVDRELVDIVVNIDPVGPVTDETLPYVSLAGVLTLEGDTSQTLTLELTPLGGVDAVSVTEISGTLDVVQTTLDNAYATITDCGSGIAEILATLTDECDLSASAVIDIAVYQAPFTSYVSSPASEIVSSNTPTNIPVDVSDTDTHELSVVVSVHHGYLNIPSTDADAEGGLVKPPVTYIGTEGPDGRPLEDGARIGLRGPIPNLNAALADLTYTSFPGYTGTDVMTVVVSDTSFRDLGAECETSSTSITPIAVV